MRYLMTIILCASTSVALAQRTGTPPYKGKMPFITPNYPIVEPGPVGCPHYTLRLSDLGPELTRLSATAACMPPPTPCRKSWNNSVSTDFYAYNVATQLLRDYPEVMVNSNKQGAVIAKARSVAAAMAPAGKKLFRVEFFSEKHGTGPHPQWRVWARAFYGRCGTPN